tara:strand:- start:44 stop:394 length:351 start_codon:yes stop_codon:yes gene_type:complete
MIFKHKGLYLDKSPVHGIGVFTDLNIKKGDLIEECPIPQTLLKAKHSHLFSYPLGSSTSFIPTGFSIHLNCNDNDPNVVWTFDEESFICYFKARKNIDKGSELFISYASNKSYLEK